MILDKGSTGEQKPKVYERQDIKEAKKARNSKKLNEIEKKLKEFSSDEDEEKEDDFKNFSKTKKVKESFISEGPLKFKTPIPVRSSGGKHTQPQREWKPKDYNELADYFGVKMEPFNMKSEQEQKLVDDQGSFLFKNVDKEIDPWLNTVDEKGDFDKIDENKYDEHLKKRSVAEMDQELQLNFFEGKEQKTLLASLLLSGDTATKTMKRLKEQTMAKSFVPFKKNVRKKTAEQTSTNLGKKNIVCGIQQDVEIQKMQQDIIIDACDKLVAAGYYDVYSHTKEEIQMHLDDRQEQNDSDDGDMDVLENFNAIRKKLKDEGKEIKVKPNGKSKGKMNEEEFIIKEKVEIDDRKLTFADNKGERMIMEERIFDKLGLGEIDKEETEIYREKPKDNNIRQNKILCDEDSDEGDIF